MMRFLVLAASLLWCVAYVEGQVATRRLDRPKDRKLMGGMGGGKGGGKGMKGTKGKKTKKGNEVDDLKNDPYQIALWGDLPYTGDSVDVFDSENEFGPTFQALRNTVNSYDIAFSIHSGDVKSGGGSCGELNYRRFEDLINSFDHPALLSLGDNCWTDCHRLSNGNYNPLERLYYLRHRFYNEDGYTVFGTGGFETVLYDDDYPEIQLWDYGNVMYINGHIVGTNNGLYDGVDRNCDQYLDMIDPGCQHSNNESIERTKVVNGAVSYGFEQAKKYGMAGVMVAIQANIFGGPCLQWPDCSIEYPVQITTGFTDFWENLVAEALDFGKPVVLFHGDSHYYQVFPNPDGRAANLVAVQNPGSADIGWVLCDVDPESDEVFTFTHIDNTP